MPRYKLTIEYAGTRYSGWQIQQNARTVQGELVRALGRPRSAGRSRRTDRAAPTLACTRSARSRTRISRASCRRRRSSTGRTTRCPHDINVLAAERVPPAFHARHSAVARSYLYQISTRRSAFAKPFVWWVRDPLDVAAMREAADPARRLRRFPFVHRRRPGGEVDAGPRSRRSPSSRTALLLLIRIEGSHFLWKMVRRIVGVLVAVGHGEIAGAGSRRMADARVRRARAAHRAGVRPVPRTRHLRRRLPAAARAGLRLGHLDAPQGYEPVRRHDNDAGRIRRQA